MMVSACMGCFELAVFVALLLQALWSKAARDKIWDMLLCLFGKCRKGSKPFMMHTTLPMTVFNTKVIKKEVSDDRKD